MQVFRFIRVGTTAVLLLSAQIIATAQPVVATCSETIVFVNPRSQGDLTVDLGKSKIRVRTNPNVGVMLHIDWGPWGRLGSGVVTIPAGAERSRTVQQNEGCHPHQIRIRWSDGNDWVDKVYPGHDRWYWEWDIFDTDLRIVLPAAATPGSLVGAAAQDPTRAFTGWDGGPVGLASFLDAIVGRIVRVVDGADAETIAGTEPAS